MRKQTTGMYEHQVSGRVEYLTPRFITDSLGPFDLDPCASDPRPWDIAKVNYTKRDDGLSKPWKGYVWLNPPYGVVNQMNAFMTRLARHNHGIALLNSNTQTKLWQQIIFPTAAAFFFCAGRFNFLNVDGTPTTGTYGSPVLIAFGRYATNKLQKFSYSGHYLENTHAR